MNGSVTVSVKSVLLAALVLLGLVTAYLLGGQGDVGAPASASTEPEPEPESATGQEPQRLVRMTASGEATAVPDEMSFALSVTAKRDNLDDALAAASTTMRRVLAELEKHGVTKTDVQTTGLQMHPEYDYPAYSPPVLTGYRVTQRATVHVRELAKGGTAVAAAVETGGDGVRVRNMRLEIGDPDAVLEQARDAAVEEATAKAEQYAGATGQALGDVVGIREVGTPARPAPQPVHLQSYRSAALADMKMPIRAGEDELKVQVEVVWSIA